MNIHHRAVDVFTVAANDILQDVAGINADHSAKGLLQSGATVKRSWRAYRDRSTAALDQILREVANVVDHRGKAWTTALSDVEVALEAHIAGASELMDGQFNLAGLQGGAGTIAAETMLGYTAADLRKQLAAFRDGLTAPRPRSWVERHPLTWGLATALIGAAAGSAVTALLGGGG